MQVLEAYQKVSILVVIHSMLDWNLKHLVPRPNVFMLALAFSPESVPDVFFFFFFSDLKHSDSVRPHAAAQTTRLYTQTGTI